MRGLEFLPNSPTLMNAGRKTSNCQPVSLCRSKTRWTRYSMLSNILHSSTRAAENRLQLLRLRPKESGSEARVESERTGLFHARVRRRHGGREQGGARRGANMGILRVDHPTSSSLSPPKQAQTACATSTSPWRSRTNSWTRLPEASTIRLSIRYGETCRASGCRRRIESLCMMAWKCGDLEFSSWMQSIAAIPHRGWSARVHEPCVNSLSFRMNPATSDPSIWQDGRGKRAGRRWTTGAWHRRSARLCTSLTTLST